jgi:hypothetical protein
MKSPAQRLAYTGAIVDGVHVVRWSGQKLA